MADGRAKDIPEKITESKTIEEMLLKKGYKSINEFSELNLQNPINLVQIAQCLPGLNYNVRTAKIKEFAIISQRTAVNEFPAGKYFYNIYFLPN